MLSTACFYDETVEQLGRTFQRTGRQATELERGFTRASGGANILTRSVSSLGGVLGALGFAAVTHQLGRLSIESVRAAGSMEQLRRATEQIQGALILFISVVNHQYYSDNNKYMTQIKFYI